MESSITDLRNLGCLDVTIWYVRECETILLFSGDHLAVYPINNEELVNKLGELLNVDLDTVITLTNTDGMTT
jgi:sulfite reductase alpha subunit-like flavoprotein